MTDYIALARECGATLDEHEDTTHSVAFDSDAWAAFSARIAARREEDMTDTTDFPPLPPQATIALCSYDAGRGSEIRSLAQNYEPGSGCAQYTADQMHAYVLADRASRAPAQDLHAEIERLRAGLQWYADGEHYVLDGWDEPDEPGWLCPDEGDHPWMVESGNTARLILKGAVMVNDGETICAMPLAAAPSAQAPTGEGARCVCGDPTSLGVVHRTDGPCFVYEEPQAAPGAPDAVDDGTLPTAMDELELLYAQACEERDHLRKVLAEGASRAGQPTDEQIQALTVLAVALASRNHPLSIDQAEALIRQVVAEHPAFAGIPAAPPTPGTS